MGAPFTHRIRVRYGECDPQGIVFNANYVAYADHTFTEIWREAFGSYRSMVERGVDMVVAEIKVSFHGSARFDDLIEIAAVVDRLGTTAMTTRLEMRRGEELLAEAAIRHVFVDTESWEKTEIPEWVRTELRRYQLD